MMDHSGFHCTFIAKEPLWIGRGPAQSSCLVGPRDGDFRKEYSANKMILNNISRVIPATSKALQMGLVGKELDEEIRRRSIFGVDLSISLEPLPDPNNRLTLSTTRKDPHGLPCRTFITTSAITCVKVPKPHTSSWNTSVPCLWRKNSTSPPA